MVSTGRRGQRSGAAVGRSGAPGRVRVIGGSLRGSRIEVAAVDGLRPTPDRVRETLFNWLAPVIDGSRCLDLYAGTGALGLEAASRGAREVVLVESDRRAAEALRANVARLKAAACRVLESDALAFLGGTAQPFDVVFVDPPFAADAWAATALALDRGWLAPQAFVYLESPADVIPVVPAGWLGWRELRAGAVRAALYRRAPAP
jgi:16S rRNA (guanine966-N2)-methyltransferase